MNEWMDGWMDGWINGWMDGWINGFCSQTSMIEDLDKGMAEKSCIYLNVNDLNLNVLAVPVLKPNYNL